MKKFLFILFGVFAVAGAFAAGENIPTSKSYVDAAATTKQDIIPANDGATQVLTNTGTAGEYGAKGIYDANGEYAAQTQNLVDAATMNVGVQNAIDSEFQCIEWLDPNDHTSDCLLFNVFGTPPQQILPTGYTALEYIESTGTQYINTKHTLHGTDTVEIKYSDLIKIHNDNMLFGHYSANSFAYNLLGGTIYVYLHSVNGVPFNRIQTNDNYVHTVKLGNNEFYFDNTLMYHFVDRSTDFYTSSNSYIFSANGHYISKAKVYYYKVVNLSGEIIQNLIPARRDSDGEIGMYDTVSNTFFTNAGTGEFIAGPVVNLYLPNGE